MLKNLSSHLLFLKESVKQFRTQGALLPSSSFLADAMLKPLEQRDKMMVVELGAGTGAFTKKILSRLPQNGRLLIIDLNRSHIHYLRRIVTETNVFIVEGNAENLTEYLSERNLPKADYIISGLPLGNFSRFAREKVFRAVSESLTDDGLYIQFQYFLANWRQIKESFDATISRYEIRNLPPAFVYCCKKKSFRPAPHARGHNEQN